MQFLTLWDKSFTPSCVNNAECGNVSKYPMNLNVTNFTLKFQ